MQVERTAARLLGVQVDLPRLAQRVRLDEVPLVVHVEPVVDGVVLQVGHEAGDVDDSHEVPAAASEASRQGGTGPRRRSSWCRDHGGPLTDAADRTARRPSPRRWAALERAPRRRARDRDQPGQYRSDLAADAAALPVLAGRRVGVLSEESGLGPTRPVTRRRRPARRLDQRRPADLPWYATSLCAVDADGPRAALVVNLAHRHAVRARCGARERAATAGRSARRRVTRIGRAMSAERLSDRAPGWQQYRALGAAALDLCAWPTARSTATLDCAASAHGPWDYLGGMLVLPRRARRSSTPTAASWWRSTTTLGARRSRRPPPSCSTSCSTLADASAWVSRRRRRDLRSFEVGL